MTRTEMNEYKRVWLKAWRKRSVGKCMRCGGRPLPGRKGCAACHAYWTERQRPGIRHDTECHAEAIAAAHRPRSRCCLTGLTADVLARIGSWLEVDRIDPRRGYVPGNVQLMAAPLNRSKGKRPAPRPESVARILARVAAL